MTRILVCGCSHTTQDQWYGKSKRVHNELKKTTSGDKFRCTVCGEVKAG